MFQQLGTPAQKLAIDYELSLASIRRIVFRGLAFPGIYELEVSDAED